MRDWEWCLMGQKALRKEYVSDFILWIILNFMVITWRSYPIIILNTTWNLLGNCGSFDYFLSESVWNPSLVECCTTVENYGLKWFPWEGSIYYKVYSKQSHPAVKNIPFLTLFFLKIHIHSCTVSFLYRNSCLNFNQVLNS